MSYGNLDGGQWVDADRLGLPRNSPTPAPRFRSGPLQTG